MGVRIDSLRRIKRKRITGTYKNRRSRSLRSSKKRLRKTLKRRNKVNIPIKRGLLSKYGYTSKDTTKVRQRSLKRAIKKYGRLSLFRKLNAIYVLQKNRNPRASQIFKKDRDWVKKHYFSK